MLLDVQHGSHPYCRRRVAEQMREMGDCLASVGAILELEFIFFSFLPRQLRRTEK